MGQALDRTVFTIFDTETTGLNPETGDRIVELAALRLRGDVTEAVFETLIDPQRPVSPAAFAVNHISDAMLAGKPVCRAVLPEFLRFIQGSCVCAYNARFDLAFLRAELAAAGLAEPAEMIVADILRLARRLLPGQERYSLQAVAQALGLGIPQAHRAGADVELTARVFLALLGLLQAKGIRDTDTFLDLCALPHSALAAREQEKISRIQEAIDDGARLAIRYLAKSGGPLSQRLIVPQQILKENGVSYVRGHCLLRGAERTFRVDAIVSLELVAAEGNDA